MVLEGSFVKMYYFAIDFEIEMPYPLAPPQGWEVILGSLKNSSWQIATVTSQDKPKR